MMAKPRERKNPIPRPPIGPPEHLRAASQALQAHPEMAADPRFVELLAAFLEAHAVSWDLRPTDEWELFEASPSAALAQYIRDVAAGEQVRGGLVTVP